MSNPFCPVIKKPGEQPQLQPALSDQTTFVFSGNLAFGNTVGNTSFRKKL